MNPQIKQKWVSALRSGDYKQTQHRLRKEDGFCCLGVLCDLYIKENNEEWKIDGVGDYFYEQYKFPPLSVIEWSGLVSDNPSVCNGKTSLGYLNDNGTTFNEIADLIEEHL